MNQILAANLKRLRISKNYTQEQAAELLGISAQTVSRWECGTTLPDVLLLPEIARLYCVTIDDLYKNSVSAYENYAQRLASVYEDTRDPEDFIRVDAEYKNILKKGPLSAEDLRTYGVAHHFMMNYCKDKALKLFNEVLKMKSDRCDDLDDTTYWRTRYQRLGLRAQIGQSEKNISEQLEHTSKYPEISREWALLISAYIHADQSEKAYEAFLTAVEKFPDDWDILVQGGDCCRALKKYIEAFQCWDKALELEPDFIDPKYSKVFAYEELGEFEKAYALRCELAEYLKNSGFEVEAQAELACAEKCREKICL